MNRPDNIGLADWNELQKKYNGVLPQDIVNKLNNDYPIQYLIGNVDFYDINVLVDERVLIPRYETELLVKKTIDIINEENVIKPKILDIGTGSGVIAISLAKHLGCVVDAIDNKSEILSLARINADKNKVALNLIKKDILLDDIALDYDFIISNPPYVSKDEDVDPKTKYEPQAAIFADNNGLEFYEKIISLAKNNRQKPFWILLEIGNTQGLYIKNLIEDNFSKSVVKIEKDFNDRDRYVIAQIIA